MNNREKGGCYEDIASSFFESIGCTILEKNYKRKVGEIDLIVDDHGVIVFVEVKYRGRTRSGYPAEAVTLAKQKRIYRCAQWYLQEHKLSENTPCRFDVISIMGKELTQIKNAFGGF